MDSQVTFSAYVLRYLLNFGVVLQRQSPLLQLAGRSRKAECLGWQFTNLRTIKSNKVLGDGIVTRYR